MKANNGMPIYIDAPKAPKAKERQIGGSHYKDMMIQPTEFIHKNKLSFIQGNIIKYVCRYKFKNGVEDLEKAKHYIDLLIEFEKEEESKHCTCLYPLIRGVEGEGQYCAGCNKPFED